MKIVLLSAIETIQIEAALINVPDSCPTSNH
jgi:hypothetical protein